MFLIKYDKRKELSIHAPTRGATVVSLKCYIQIFFQSTLLQEERLVNFTHIGILNAFNPRSYKRSDASVSVSCEENETFNPRSYKRSDTSKFNSNLLDTTFNPRSYKRSDPTRTPTANPHILSIHAPTRGATTVKKNCI